MDPITTASLIHDRTQELQRTADQVRQERTLRSNAIVPVAVVEATAVGAPARPDEPQRSPAMAGSCSPAEPAI